MGGGAHPASPPPSKGHDTKIFMNSTQPPSKRSSVERSVDYIIFFMFGLLFSMCITGCIYFAWWTHTYMPQVRAGGAWALAALVCVVAACHSSCSQHTLWRRPQLRPPTGTPPPCLPAPPGGWVGGP